MYEKVIGTLATPIDEQQRIFTNKDLLFTSTPYVEKNLLSEYTFDSLTELEKDLTFPTEKLKGLEEMIKLFHDGESDKEELNFRAKSLKNLYFINEKISAIESEEKKDVYEELQQLKSLIKASSSGPIRSFLENKITTWFNEINQVKNENQDLIKKINHVKSYNEVDEIICELNVEEYINLGKKGREMIAKQFIELSNSYEDKQEILQRIRQLVSNFDNSNISTIQNKNRESTNEFFNESISLEHLESFKGKVKSITVN